MRMVPVLEGPQFRGKSTALATIGGEWFSDTPFQVGDKDSFMALRGKMLYEIAELDAFNRAEATRVKGFVSSRSDNFRAPYDSRNRDWPRQCVLAATTNQHEYLKDPSGNTRFAPLATGEEIKLDELARDRDQLFAEAVVRYRAGEHWHPTREQQAAHFTPQQQEREIEDPWAGRIADWLAKQQSEFHASREIPILQITMNQVLDECLKVEVSKVDGARQMATRVGLALKRSGWTKRRALNRGYFYEPPEAVDPEQAGKGASGATVPF
jgi:putative DNA primase/helicase